MDSKDAATEIICKMLETKSFLLACQTTDHPTAEDLAKVNQENIQMIGDAFTTLRQSIHESKHK
jgi:hypothetical protein